MTWILPSRGRELHGWGKLARVRLSTSRRDLRPPALFCLVAAAGLLLPVVSGADEMRDFPPLLDPNRPRPTIERPEPQQPPPPEAPVPPAAEEEPYRLGVGDEVRVVVLDQPDFSVTVKVRPDGALTTPGAGTVHALGKTPEEVSRMLEERLRTLLRHPHVDLVVANFGEQRIFVMGEVEIPGDKPYYKGITALQAIAQSGGIGATGKTNSVLVLRRTAQDEAEIRKLDLKPALKGAGPGDDLVLRPFDIVYVPRTFIADLNVFVDQYFRQMVPPFTLYMEGWKAFNLGTDKVQVITGS